MVWVHLRKDRFPGLRGSNLKPRGAGPYKVLAKINDNAYSIDIPIAEFGGASNNFNVADLSPYMGDDLGASRSTPFEGGGYDEDIPTNKPSPTLHEAQPNDEIRIGPITRARAKLIEQQVNSLLIDSDMLCNENFILPKSLYVCMIRYHDEDKAQGGKVRFRSEGTRQKDFGRPTHFGRPTLDEDDASVFIG